MYSGSTSKGTNYTDIIDVTRKDGKVNLHHEWRQTDILKGHQGVPYKYLRIKSATSKNNSDTRTEKSAKDIK